MKVSAQFVSIQCRRMVAMLALASCVGLISVHPLRGAESASAKPPPNPKAPKAQDKPVVAPPGKEGDARTPVRFRAGPRKRRRAANRRRT